MPSLRDSIGRSLSGFRGERAALVSMDADRAAFQILEAVRNRRPELTITFAARLAATAQALLPNLTADLLKLTAR